MRESPRVIGQLLLLSGGVTNDQLQAALREQESTRERIGEILVRGGTDPERIAQALALQLKLPFAPAPLSPQRDALALLDRPVAARMRVVPLAIREKAVTVAMADPLDISAIDDMQFRTGRRVEPAVATPQAVERGLAAYDATEVASLLTRIPAGAAVTQSDDDLRRASEAPPIVALLDYILARAAAARASDVHVEPLADRLLVRVRVDGTLRELLTLPLHVTAALVSRIKVVANLDISIRRKPQDGRCVFHCTVGEVAARVSTLPAHHGEKIVLRLLSSSTDLVTLDAIGMGPVMLGQLRAMLQRTHGVILVTGPTGSGKTSTLYAALGELDRRTRNIVTLEDPVERKLEGITQVQVNRRGGTTFARALRAVLRQDPDIILIGELRDRETVETALAAAMTGHLVLSTLHTNDAASAATRLIEMGAPPYLICGALIGVLAQRLARRLCPHCRIERDLTNTELAQLGIQSEFAMKTFEPGRCSQCDDIGYRGRVGVFELIGTTAPLRERIMKRAPSDVLRTLVRQSGQPLMSDDAWGKVLAGVTSLDEARPLLQSGEVTPKCRCGKHLHVSWMCCPYCGTRPISMNVVESPARALS